MHGRRTAAYSKHFFGHFGYFSRFTYGNAIIQIIINKAHASLLYKGGVCFVFKKALTLSKKAP